MNTQSQILLWSATFFILIGFISTVCAFGIPSLTLGENTLDTTMSTIGSKTTYTGAAGTTFSWIFSSEFGIAAGVLIGILGFALNWYYSRKRDQREQAVHEVLMNFKDNMEANKFMKIHGSLNDGK